jgi:glyoxylase-like metal-dependent hydrolase (beta-lactamase superfamily II)
MIGRRIAPARTPRIGALLIATAIAVTAAHAQQRPERGVPPVESGLHILPLRGNVYVLVGGGANITISTGREGTLLVDTGTAADAEKVLAAVRELSTNVNGSPVPILPCAGLGCAGVRYPSYLGTIAAPAPPRPLQYIVNTNADDDHTGGNATIARAGTTIGGGPGLGPFVAQTKESATVYAHENVQLAMSAAKAPTAALPTESFETDLKQFFNGEGIHLIHQPAAHGSGDTIVYFRGSDVIAAGDILSTVSYPVFDPSRGGSINGIVAGLNHLLDLVIAEYQTEGGTLLVPGHGRVCDAADLATYRDMVTILRDRIQKMIARGMTLEQVNASRPTKDYDPRYDVPSWPKEKFVAAVYQSLSARK